MKISSLILTEHWTEDGAVRDFDSHPLTKFFKDYLFRPEDNHGLVDYPHNNKNIRELLASNAPAPDLVILIYPYLFGNHKALLQLMAKWKPHSFILGIWGEPFHPFNVIDYVISSLATDTDTSLYFIGTALSPYIQFLQGTPWRQTDSIHSAELLSSYSKMHRHLSQTPKTRFCNFIYGHGANKQFPGTILRNKLCKKLMEYQKVDCAGKIKNNTDELTELDQTINKQLAQMISSSEQHRAMPAIKPDNTINRFLNKLHYISHYKFTIAGENTIRPRYISEKILHPLIVGSIPIYSGSPDINKIINPKAFINAHDFSSLEDLVAYVKKVNETPSLYEEYISQPAFHPESIISQYSRSALIERFTPMMNKIIKHKERHQHVPHQSKFSLYQLLRHKPMATAKIMTKIIDYKLKSGLERIHSRSRS